MSINKFSNRELQKEYEHLKFLLTHNDKTICHLTDQEKGTILVQVYVKPETNSVRLMDFIDIPPQEIIAKLDDKDREVCSKLVTVAINGLHWKCSKGYCRENCTEYYIKPDWKYWYSLKP